MKTKHLVFITHGYTATKHYTKPLADHLSNLGYKVHNASMKGHDVESNIVYNDGLYPPFPEEEFKQTYFDDWFNSVEEQFLDYVKQGYKLSLIGHSMGGVISLKLAQKYPENIHSLIILASPLYMNRLYPLEMRVPSMPMLYLFNRFIKKFPISFKNRGEGPEFNHYPPQLISLFKNFGSIRRNLNKIYAPILIIQAFDDKHVPDSMPAFIARKVSSTIKLIKMYTIQDSHCNKHAIAWHPETKDTVYNDITNFLLEQKLEKENS